jgi:hypothetical protein
VEVFVINAVLAAILIYLLIRKIRKDAADGPRRWDDPPPD